MDSIANAFKPDGIRETNNVRYAGCLDAMILRKSSSLIPINIHAVPTVKTIGAFFGTVK